MVFGRDPAAGEAPALFHVVSGPVPSSMLLLKAKIVANPRVGDIA